MSTLVVADFNADLFARLLANSVPDTGEVQASDYGQVFQTLIEIQQPGAATRHDHLIVWVRPESLFPALQRALNFEPFTAEQILAEVREFAAAIKAAAANIANVWVMSMYSEAGAATHGMLNYRAGSGIRYWIDRINVELAEQFSGHHGIFLLDAARYFSGLPKAHAPKLYYTAKVPYVMEVFKRAAQDVSTCLDGLKGKARRVLVLDLDDTLWGGILGDVGANGINLGGHDHVGEAFADFQKAVKRLAKRGVALAIASKNYEANALAVFDNHPEMLIRRANLSAWRINWQDKAQNIVDIAKELNLGLSSLVFIDDNPAERARVAEALPEVLVPDWPTDPAEYVSALNALTCFNVPTVSAEDAQRTQMFAAERDRQQLKDSLSHADWLKTIGMQVTVERLNPGNLARIVQLINKTNQFNARTRRVTEAEMLAMHETQQATILAFRVADKYGESGLTGVISAHRQGDDCHIVDFVMSCRVMGRGVERLMLSALAELAARQGAQTLVCRFVESERNLPMREFLDDSGLQKQGDGYRWDLSTPYPCPGHISVTQAGA